MARGPRPAARIRATRPAQTFDGCSHWDEFLNRYWEREPVVIEGPFAQPLVRTADAFAALRCASDDFRTSRAMPSLRVNVDGGFLLVDMDERLPDAADQDFEAYAARIAPWLAGRQFLVTLNEYQGYDVHFWRNLRVWLRGFLARVGLPSGRFLTDLWFGMYQRTPFGIHTDHDESFVLLLEGRKKMLVWPQKAFESGRIYRTPGGDHIGTVHYEPYLDDAIVLEAGPGDVMYWPEGYWHIGVSDGTPSLACNWSYINRHLPRTEALDLVLDSLRDMATQALGDAGRVDSYPQAPELPAQIATALATVRSLVASGEAEDLVRASWLNRVTALGLRDAPPHGNGSTSPVLLEDDDVLAAQPGDLTLWSRSTAGEYLVSCNGSIVGGSPDGAVTQLLERLGTGTPQRVRELEAGLRFGPGGAAYARLLLESIVAAGGATRIADLPKASP
jgi:50S ribosomal protein L16 3-hydroxylase